MLDASVAILCSVGLSMRHQKLVFEKSFEFVDNMKLTIYRTLMEWQTSLTALHQGCLRNQLALLFPLRWIIVQREAKAGRSNRSRDKRKEFDGSSTKETNTIAEIYATKVVLKSLS